MVESVEVVWLWVVWVLKMCGCQVVGGVGGEIFVVGVWVVEALKLRDCEVMRV